MSTIAIRKPAVWCPGMSRDTSIARGLRGYWPLWEGHGDRVANLAAPVGDGVFSEKYDGYPRWEPTKYGSAVAMYPQNPADYLQKQNIDFGTSAWLAPTAQVTVMMRTYPQANANYAYFMKGNVSAIAWAVGINNSQIRFVVNIGGTNREINVAFSAWNAWQFVVGTYDGRAMRLYNNGKLVAGPTAYSGVIGQASGVRTNLGALLGYSGYSFRAKFSELGLWDRALQPAEIRWLYRDPFGLCQMAAQPQGIIASGGLLLRMQTEGLFVGIGA